jgi:hypothetical protein
METASITFCAFSGEPLYEVLKQSLAGRTVNGRPVWTRQIGGLPDAQHCQIVFVSGLDKRRLGEVLAALAGLRVLTVSDADHFAQRGGMIQLIKEANKYRFIINMDAAQRNGLRISSKLLQLAEVVHAASGDPGRRP